ncbi:hypothetical protein GGX14DRAFT_485316 [Mycena pura]|uniref:Mug135-like C-terminal domain-containing protein n=1 Tax=Mycena pura TaxID=153505 RepID=A0AAD6Y2W6_9AGAR|nr:hypothetical protein GGX14DRAFT_485316 [Mycena pura]
MKASLDDIKQHVSVTLSKAVDEIKRAGSVTTRDAVDELKKAGDVTMQQAVDKMTMAADGIAKLIVDEIKNTADGTTQRTVDKLKKAVKEMNYALDAKVNQLARVTAQNFNANRADGSLVPFAVVAFPDGTIPSANPNTPTVLTSIEAIKSLSAVELGHYCNRYDVGEGGSTPDDLAERQDAVRVAIGCTRKIS